MSKSETEIEASFLEKLKSVKTNDQLIEVLDMEPPAHWVKVHPELKDHKYIEIEKTLLIFRSIFKMNWKTKILDSKIVGKSISVTVRVYYRDFDGQWLSHDGICADQPDSSAYGVAASLPLAKSLAIKNASMLLGRVFGSGLNKTEIDETPKETIEEKLKNLFESIEDKIGFEDSEHITRILTNKEAHDYQKCIDLLTKKYING